MFNTTVGFGNGFGARPVLSEGKTQTSVIGGKKIKEKKGRLSKALGKPAMKASKKELESYVDSAGGAEKKKRVARVNLMKAHRKGLKAQGKKPKAATESANAPLAFGHVLVQSMPTFAVVTPRYSH